ncbi:MAG: type I restriction enzyme HsdR N-terminal domain-containing protein [Bacteroidales bacterium]|nr:type I restriction enzyme HsdR N-terminal domain-containing protein [Bacteroidales bacterium]MCL2133722.1 type I restriction enzyme HsdR N-terminal domain-containing protein [Bacteroidales bacterium]
MNFTPRLRDTERSKEIFDPVRKKYVVLTPEEWVRQQLLYCLITEYEVPQSLIGVEIVVPLGKRSLRADIIVYDRKAVPLLIAECKAENVKIDKQTFMQIAGYNLTLQVPWLLVSNGRQLYCCKWNPVSKEYDFVTQIPKYNEW